MTAHALVAQTAAVSVAAMLTGAQIRAARALLRWSGRELAERCGVSYPAIQRAEAVDGLPNMQSRNLMAIRRALELGGAVFMESGHPSANGGPGVRLRD